MVQGVQVENGELVNINPATGKEIGRVKISTPAEVDAAVRCCSFVGSRFGSKYDGGACVLPVAAPTHLHHTF
jgi:hypothetical protein